MTERIDHVAEALRHAERADDLAQYMPDAMQAMIHATLALVEQQRIANLLNLAQFQSATDEGQRLITSLEHAAKLRLMASTALGLEPGES